MRTTQLSILLASVSLAVAGLLYVKVDRLGQRLGSARAEPAREGRGAGQGGVELPSVSVRVPAGEGTPRPAGVNEGQAGGVVAWDASRDGPGSGGSVEERLARLEERQRTLDEGGHGMPWRHAQMPVRNVDELSKKLSLTATQRSRIEDAIARGRQRIEDVLKIPDETGKSPFERRAEARKKLEEAMKNPAGGGIMAFATDLVAYRERKIPGRGDTYGDEINRIRKETREEMATALDARQQETFRDTNVDGLLGEAAQVSFAYSVGTPGDEGGMIIGMEESIVEEDSGSAAPAPQAPSGR